MAEALAEAPGVEDAAAVLDTTGSNVIIGAVTPATAGPRPYINSWWIVPGL